MILNGDEIIVRHAMGDIDIIPWDPKRVGPNSYDVTLYNIVKRYDMARKQFMDGYLDPKNMRHELESIEISSGGYCFHPGEFLLGATAEINNNHADDLVPMIEGRSSVARLGLSIHITAGFGDIGFCGRWTLEMTTAVPVIIYPGMPIGQIYWIKTTKTDRKYNGKYQNQAAAVESLIQRDFDASKPE
jgi:dCTP deaminase